MKKIVLGGIGLCWSAFAAFAQTLPDSLRYSAADTFPCSQYLDQQNSVAQSHIEDTDSIPAHHDRITLADGDEHKSSDSISRAQRPDVHSSFLHDHGDIWSSPFRMDWEDAAVVGGIVATTAVLIAVDEPIYRGFRDYRNENAWVRRVSPIASQFGEFYVPFGVAALYCLNGLAFDDDESLDTGLLAAQAMIHSGIVVQVLKHVFGRTRPFVRNGEDIWYGPRVMFKRYNGGFSPYDSFPSGHTITAFSLATVIAERSDKFWVGAVAYSFAGLCGLSRLTQRDHWLSDVVVGAAMGIAIGKLVVRNHEKRLEITPSIGMRSAGMSLQLHY